MLFLPLAQGGQQKYIVYATVGRAFCVQHQLQGCEGANAPFSRQYIHMAFQPQDFNAFLLAYRSKESTHHMQYSLRLVHSHQ